MNQFEINVNRGTQELLKRLDYKPITEIFTL
jgi:hypothetical protein